MLRRLSLSTAVSSLSLATALTFAPCAASAQAHLDDATIATRRQLIETAQQARTQGDHTRALELAQRAGQLQMTTSLRRFIAEEDNALGRVAEALGSADACVSEAQHDATGASAQHLAACQTLSNSLRSRVGHVVVNPSEHITGMRIQIAGNEIPEALWGVPVVVSPGNVIVDVTAPGHRPFHQEVAVAAGASPDVAIHLDMEPAAVATNDTPHTTAVVASPAPPPESDARASSGPGIAPWIVMGVGVVGIASFAMFGALQLGAVGDRNTHCGGTLALCASASDSMYDLAAGDQQRALTYTIAADVSLGIGIAALAGGLVWRIVGGMNQRHERQARAIDVQPVVGPGQLGLTGRF